MLAIPNRQWAAIQPINLLVAVTQALAIRNKKAIWNSRWATGRLNQGANQSSQQFLVRRNNLGDNASNSTNNFNTIKIIEGAKISAIASQVV